MWMVSLSKLSVVIHQTIILRCRTDSDLAVPAGLDSSPAGHILCHNNFPNRHLDPGRKLIQTNLNPGQVSI